MAKKREETKLNYRAEVQKLHAEGPRTLYFLHGKEDYLREQFLIELKRLCIPEGEGGFNYKRFDGPGLSSSELRGAVEALPFLSEHTFVELRDIDVNKLEESAEILSILADIPTHCTVCFVQSGSYEPDGRIKAVKSIRETGYEMVFSAQSQDALISWIARRFASQNKKIGLEEAKHLIFVSGDLMNRLIPEIEKVAAYATKETVTIRDIEAVAHHIPEAQVFVMTDELSKKHFDAAMTVLSELLAGSEHDPVYLLSVLATQMRRLFCAKLAVINGLGSRFVSECCSISYDFIVARLMASASSFSLDELKRALRICADTDLKMKSGGGDGTELLLEAVLSIASGVRNAAR